MTILNLRRTDAFVELIKKEALQRAVQEQDAYARAAAASAATA